jgi:NNP family nitrate/nitrite transporter-like MFS transporter
MGIGIGVSMLNIPPALDRLMQVYDVSYTRISVLISALFWSHAVMQFLGGMVVDRIGTGRALFLCLSCQCFGNVVPTVSPVIEVAILGRVITGIGTGLAGISTLKLVAVYAPRGRIGAYQAFFGGFFCIGSILPYLLIPCLLEYGWRWAYWVPAGTCLPLLAMLVELRLKPTDRILNKPLPLVQILCIKEAWILGLYHAISWGALITLGSWMPSLLAEVWKDEPVIRLAWGGALVMGISGMGRLSGGFFLFKLGPLKVANGSILILSMIFLALSFLSTPGPVLAMALMAAWFSSFNFGAFFHLASSATSASSLGTLLGFFNFLANLGAIVFALMFGWMKDNTGTFSWGFAILAALSVGAYLIGRTPLRKGLASRGATECESG